MKEIYRELADAIFPNIEKDYRYYIDYYKDKREKNKVVTRFAPSPTGFMHTGGLYTAIVNQSYAKQNDGTFYLRIEDTDQARKLENGVSEIIDTLNDFDISFDEGPINENEDKGGYAPYRQSQRKEIYMAFAKELIMQGKAYPCFCTKEELDEIRQKQIESGSSIIGYAGVWAKYRDLPVEEALKRVKAGEDYVIRLKSPVTESKKIVVEDVVRGKIEMEDNYIDIVIIKGDGLPTYHFAHVVDDYLMGTTIVIRADEWLPSLPLHLQMFKMLDLNPPKYAHICPILKMDGQSKRKLSKRKDPEARAGYYIEMGYPVVAVKEYLINLINSRFEIWREQNPLLSYKDFDIKLEDMSKSGALFDMKKLENVSKRIIKNMPDDEVFDLVKAWSKDHDKELYQKIMQDEARFLNSITIWHKNRMDVACFSEIKSQFNYLYNDDFVESLEKCDMMDMPYFSEILKDYLDGLDLEVEQSVWFDRVRQIAGKYNYAIRPKDFKNNPSLYNGSIVEVSTFIRLGLTGRKDSPDIFEISKFIGIDEVKNRINRLIEFAGK